MKRKLPLIILLTVVAGALLAFRLLGDDPLLLEIKQKLHDYQRKTSQEKIYLHTDKPVYYPHEDIWFSGYLTDTGNKPGSSLSHLAYVELINPKGNVQRTLKLLVQGGKIKGDFKLGGTGGIYKIRAYTHWMKNFGNKAFFEKKIVVQQVIKPRLLLKLDFAHEKYGQGDTVTALFTAKDLKNRPIALQDFKYTVQLAGKTYRKDVDETGKEGKAKIRFTLPKLLKDDDGLLNIIISYEGRAESIARAVPLILNQVNVQFMPEGGTWIKGVKSKMAFKATDKHGKPVDIAGEVIDKNGAIITAFNSFHQGMGAFEMTPQPGKAYRMHLHQPAGITKTFALPKVASEGFALGVTRTNEQKMQLKIHRPVVTPAYVVAQSGGKVFFTQKIITAQPNSVLNMPVAKFPVGVARITLFDQNKTPQAERIVFVNPHKLLNIEVKTKKKQYKTREKVDVEILTTNEKKEPVPANISLAVADNRLLNIADDRQDNILSYLLMSSELKGKVHEPDFYFKPEEPKARLALDYVMLTHGWRRFAWQEVLSPTFNEKYRKEKFTSISGRILNAKTGKPIAAYVTLFELKGKKRAIKLETKKDGRFLFQNVNPNVSMQLHARSVSRKKYYCRIVFAGEESPAWAGRNFGNKRLSGIKDLNAKEKKMPVNNQPSKANPAQTVFDKTSLNLSTNKNSLSEVIVMAQGVGNNPNMANSLIAQSIASGFVTQNARKQKLLYVLNGSIITNFEVLKHVHPQSIEQVYQITPQEAVMLYGSKGAQGAILIRTRTGAGKMSGYAKKAFHQLFRIYDSRYIPGIKRLSRARIFYAPVYVREEAVKQRTDFRNTIYWNPEIITNSKGKAKVSFYTSDALTSFRITAEGITRKGEIGRKTATIHTQLPLQLEVKVPPYLAVGDTVKLPVYVKNNTGQDLPSVLVVSSAYLGLKRYRVNLEPKAQSGQTVFVQGIVQPVKQESNSNTDQGKLSIRFASEAGGDEMSKSFIVFSRGFPVEKSFSGNKASNKYQVDIPEVIDKSLKVTLVVYANIIGDFMDGVAGVIKQPYGCFEQASSATYPNILALQFLQIMKYNRPKVRQKALAYISQGYKKLAAYETSQGGFEWFGRTPPHEGLTAYGLMEFVEMKKVYNGVNQAMIDRTKQWLLSRRDGKGNFKRNKGKYGFAAAGRRVTNAYLVYALAFAGVKNIMPEYKKAYNKALVSKDAYQMALLALAAHYLGKSEQSRQLTNALRTQLKWRGTGNLKVKETIVRSGGVSKQIEASALMMLAELKQPNPDIKMVKKLISFILPQRSYGYFGSTQATILTLKALAEYAQYYNSKENKGSLLVYRGKQKIASLPYSSSGLGKASINGLERYLSKGVNDISIKFANKKMVVPFSLNISYQEAVPHKQPQCAVALQTRLAKSEVNVNETVRLTTVIKNKQAEGQPSTMALVGIPAGLSPQIWQLKELQQKDKIAFYEIRGTYVIFYFRGLSPNAVKTIQLDLKAEVPGIYKAPASSAYLYYTSEYKDWQAGENILIKKAKVN